MWNKRSVTTPTVQLEATYVFPVPKGANVNKFTMWVGGKEVTGELVEAAKAREIYTSIVRRTQDPGLLEYIGSNLLQMRVFPVPARGDQKVAMSFTAIVPRDADLVEYVYPLKTDGKATSTLEDFAITATSSRSMPCRTSTAPPMPSPSSEPTTMKSPSTSSATRACSTRTSSSSTPSVTRTSA